VAYREQRAAYRRIDNKSRQETTGRDARLWLCARVLSTGFAGVANVWTNWSIPNPSECENLAWFHLFL